jgi:hypothetical protein
MVRFLEGRGSDRKFRLFACACCRRIWSRLNDSRSREAVQTAERFADGRATLSERSACQAQAREASREVRSRMNDTFQNALAAADAAYSTGFMAAILAPVGAAYVPESGTDVDEMTAQAALLRDVFGNPFRPVAFDPRWRTADTVGLATAIYEDRAFDRLGLLADALQDAECDDEQVLGHCRSEGHVRGCWVVDLVLGKE